jgi:hypothetical protein
MTHTFSGGGTASHSTIVGGTTYTDAFTRADENPVNSNWTKAGTDADTHAVQIVSNKATGTSAGLRNAMYYSGGTLAADQKAEITVEGPYTGPMVRIQSGATYLTGYVFLASADNTALQIWRYKPDISYQILKQVAGSVSSGDTLRIEVNGTAITAYKNDALISGLTTTDDYHIAGYPGAVTYHSTTYSFDDFEADGLYQLADATTYHYYVRCSDSVGNVNLTDHDIFFTVEGGVGTHTLGNFILKGVAQ